jgi:hypothetical protein
MIPRVIIPSMYVFVVITYHTIYYTLYQYIRLVLATLADYFYKREI